MSGLCSIECKELQTAGVPYSSMSKGSQSDAAAPSKGADQKRDSSPSIASMKSTRHFSTAVSSDSVADKPGNAEYFDAINEYCERHSSPEPPMLTLLRRDTIALFPGSPAISRMMCSPLQGRFLSMVAFLARPRRILELGTFSGYATLCLAEAASALPLTIVTCDIENVKSDVSQTKSGKSQKSVGPTASATMVAREYFQRYVQLHPQVQVS
jgi:hypothetical protein